MHLTRRVKRNKQSEAKPTPRGHGRDGNTNLALPSHTSAFVLVRRPAAGDEERDQSLVDLIPPSGRTGVSLLVRETEDGSFDEESLDLFDGHFDSLMKESGGEEEESMRSACMSCRQVGREETRGQGESGEDPGREK